MKTTAYIILVIFLFVAANLVWRYASRRWSLPCPSWLAWSLENSLMQWFLQTETTLDRMGLAPGQRVLEIGPGSGRLLIPAAERVLPEGEVVGLDIQAGMIERLTQRAEEASIQNLTGVVGDAQSMPFEPESFDVIFIALTLGEIPDCSQALVGSYQALKPGGILSITEFFPDPHFTFKHQVRRLAESAGFAHEATHGRWWHFTSNFTKPKEIDSAE